MRLLIEEIGGSPIDVTTYTNYNYSHTIKSNTLYKRTINGTLFTYNINSEFHRFSVPLIGISSSFASTINSMWQGQAVIAFTENDSTSPIATSFICKIVNTGKPIDTFLDAQFVDSVKNGTLLLETI